MWIGKGWFVCLLLFGCKSEGIWVAIKVYWMVCLMTRSQMQPLPVFKALDFWKWEYVDSFFQARFKLKYLFFTRIKLLLNLNVLALNEI
jgi:hypothetical protein